MRSKLAALALSCLPSVSAALSAAPAAPPFPAVTASEEGAVHGPFRPNDSDGTPIFAPRETQSHVPCSGGMAGIYPCSNIDLMSFIPLASMGCTTGNSLWGWTDPLNGDEYALMGCNNGIAFVDISDPEEPVYLGKLPSHAANSTWRDVRVYKNHAYVISEATGHGMQIFDLKRLRSVPTPPVTFTEDAYYGGFGKCHTIAINEDTGFAYPVGSNTCSGGPHMVNIQNPTSPVFAGCVASDGYTHETQCWVYHGPDVAYAGHELCFSSNEDTITIVDVTNKSTPVQLSRTSYAGVGYTHQGWLTEDHRYFFLDDELDEMNLGHTTKTRIFNVSDVNAPVLIGSYNATTPAIDHNQYVRGPYLYQANYRAGLRILNISGVASASLSEIAYFDIYPTNNSANFNGAWNVYPFFPSGNVIVSGIEQGLFVLHPTTIVDFTLSVADGALPLCSNGTVGTTLSVAPVSGYTGSVTLSTSGLPAGASSLFGANPLAVPGSTTLDITASGVAPGSYPFEVHATDGSFTHEAPIDLKISQTVPAAPPLASPAAGATNQPLIVLFTWSSVADAATYQLQAASDPSFTSILFAQTVLGTSVTSTGLPGDTLVYWRVRAHNGCGDSAWSAIRTFRTRIPPAILLVDDDDDDPDVRAVYLATLDGLGASYDVWDTHNATGGFTSDPGGGNAPDHVTEPDAAILANYRAVVWFSGDVYNDATAPKAGPTGGSETALSSYLDGGACLMLSSQDYFFDRGQTVNPFMSTYLGIGTMASDAGQITVTGTGIFNGLGPYTLDYSYLPGFNDFEDRVMPGAGGAASFNGNNLGAGVTSNAKKATFLGFGFEGLPTAQARGDVMGRFISFCGAGPGEPQGLTIVRADDDLDISWSAPDGVCEVTGYALYRGNLMTLGSGTASATSLACALTETSTKVPLSHPSLGTADYFLVVAQGASGEGSYGRDSSGAQHARSTGACSPTQDLRGCF